MFSRALLCRFAFLVCFAAFVGTTLIAAQAVPAEIDFAVGYNATAQHGVQGASFWQQGGFAELSAVGRHGLGIAAMVKGGAITNANNTGVDIDSVTAVFGPRYIYRRARLMVFGEGLVGESNAFDGVYPAPRAAVSSTNSFASLVQGGIDVALNRRFAVRLIQAGWQRTQFPNASSNVQDAFTIGAGICFRSTH